MSDLFILPTGSIVEFTRIYLAAFYTFVAVFYTIRVISKNKLTPNGVVFAGEKCSDSWWNHMLFRFFRVVIWLTCVLRVAFPELDSYLGYFKLLDNDVIVLVGNTLLTLGFVLTLIIHFNMASLWRSGVDPQGPAQLITTGFYARSRNPMFIGVVVAQFGFFLALPSVFSLLCLLIGFTAVARQIKVEETHLQQQFKTRYSNFQQKVPRWL